MPSLDSLLRVLGRAAIDVGSFRAEDLGALSPYARRRCLDLLERHRASSIDLIGLGSALSSAEEELERLVRREWLSCLHGELQDPALRRSCEVAQMQVERLERDVAVLRADLRSLTEDIGELLALQRAPRASA